MDRSFHTLPGSAAMHDTWQSLCTSRSDCEAPKKHGERHTLTALLQKFHQPVPKAS